MGKSNMRFDASKLTRTRSRASQSQERHHQPRLTKQSPSTSTTGTKTTTSLASLRECTTGTTTTTSLASPRESLPENPHIYDIADIRAAINDVLAHRLSPTSYKPSWRCNLRGREVVVFERKFWRRIAKDELRDRLSDICRSHHGSIINLLGASVSGGGGGGGDHIYLVYDYVNGASLAHCLRNPKPNFTVLSNWTSRIRIATDLAHGLDYIHNKAGLKIENLVHNHMNSSEVIVTEPDFNAKICLFGTAQLCGETDEVARAYIGW